MRIFVLAVVVIALASVYVDAAKNKNAISPGNCKKFQRQCAKGKANACRKLERLCQGDVARSPNRPRGNERPAGISDCPTSCAAVARVKVCGTNGRTYQNECLLRKERCRLNSDLDVAYLGKCRNHPRPAGQTAPGGRGRGGGSSSSEEEEEEEETEPAMQGDSQDGEEQEESDEPEAQDSETQMEQPEQSDTEQPEESDAEQPEESDAEQPEQSDTEQPEQSDTEQPEQSDAEQPEESDAEQPEESDAEQPEQSDAGTGGSDTWDGVLSVPGVP